MKKLTFIIVFLLNCFFICLNAQKIKKDSLYTLPFEILEQHFRNLSETEQRLLSEEFIIKAQNQKDSTKIVTGVFLKGLAHSHTAKSLIFLDSILSLTSRWENKLFPGIGYLEKGIQLYYLGEYEEALNFYLKAQTFFSNHKDEYNLLRIKHYIAILKNVTDQPNEALEAFEENLLFFNKEEKEKHTDQYFKSLFALADSYNRNQKYDLAEKINRKGISESYIKKSNIYPHFLLSFGTTKILNNQPSKGIDSIIKGGNLIQEKKGALCASYLKLSEAYLKLNQVELSEKYLLKIDSIYNKHQGVIHHAYTAYLNLHKIYESQDETEKQIDVINNLLSIDSLLKERKKNLSNQMIREYETNDLLFLKDQLISQSEKKLKNRQILIYLLLITLTLLSMGTFFSIKSSRNKRYRFKRLMRQSNKTSSNRINDEVQKNRRVLGISNEIVDSILKKLMVFEKSNQFIKKQYTLASLAKELKTNSSYLSKVINHEKKVNFSTYLNELKVNYIIHELKINSEYQKYSIEGIAKVAGFYNSESFNTAFYKKTGIYPSYFLNQLKKVKNRLNEL